jgi:Leucine-rich repeat (LRR) protein
MSTTLSSDNKKTQLDLSNKGLTNVPDSVFTQTQITHLNLSGNQLSELPSSIERLLNLEELDLSSNQLKKLPVGLCSLPALKKLQVQDNQLEVLPTALSQQITTLNLSNNKFTYIPDGIRKFKKLHHLNLAGNNISLLPSWIGQFHKLKSLDLENNKLRELPTLIEDLKELQILITANNKLTTLPSSIGKLERLVHLDINANLITSLPESLCKLKLLQCLDISNNRFSSLPQEIELISNIRELTVDGIPVRSLPLWLKERSLTKLSCRRCRISLLPEWIGDITTLETLHLDENNIMEIPTSIANLIHLQIFTISGNKLSKLPETNLITIQPEKITNNQPVLKFLRIVQEFNNIEAQITALQLTKYQRPEETIAILAESYASIPEIKFSTLIKAYSKEKLLLEDLLQIFQFAITKEPNRQDLLDIIGTSCPRDAIQYQAKWLTTMQKYKTHLPPESFAELSWMTVPFSHEDIVQFTKWTKPYRFTVSFEQHKWKMITGLTVVGSIGTLLAWL